MQLLDSTRSGRFRRIKKRQITNQHHFRLVIHPELPSFLDPTLLGNGKYPHPLPVHPFADSVSLGTQLVGHPVYLPVKLGKSTYIQHLLHGSFRDNLTLPEPVFHHDGHPATGKIKRDLVNLHVIIFQVLHLQLLHVRQNSPIHQVLQSRLEITVEKSVPQHPFPVIATPVRVYILFQHDLIPCQRARLIRA